MIELMITAFICTTTVGCLVLVLQHLKQYGTDRDAFHKQVTDAVTAQVEERLKATPDFYRDLETVNANQLKLANEIDLVKKTISLSTSMGAARRT